VSVGCGASSVGADENHYHRFNIMNTGPDLNFDRIAHLAKLVFNTKGVLISVVDGEEECVASQFLWGFRS
jgi:hypothetical protein